MFQSQRIMSKRQEEQRIDAELHRLVGGSDPFAGAVRATRMPMLITDPRQDDNPIVFVNDAFRRLTGYTREETLGRNCRFLQGPGTSKDDVSRVRDAVERRVAIEIELLNYRKNGTTFWNRLLISPVFDTDGDLSFFFASQFDVTPERDRLVRLAADRATLESEIEYRLLDLSAAEERLRFVLEAGRLGAWTLDLRTRRLVASVQFKAILGRQPADSLSLQVLEESMQPDGRAGWAATLAAAMAPPGQLEHDALILTPEGEERWVELRAQTRFGADGEPLGMTGVVLDISERKLAEQHRDLLTRELSHRVKNTLATVQSIVGQSLREHGADGELTSTIAERLQALAGVHDVLTHRGWTTADIRDLVAGAVMPFNARSRRIAFGGPPVKLSPRAATAMALAVHELATNATKYGALSNNTGRVAVNWETEDGHLSLEWVESGGPPVLPPTRRGFGTRLIKTALAGSTFGEVDLDYRPAGLVLRFVAPLEALIETDPPRSY